jgi:hypothetical protein
MAGLPGWVAQALQWSFGFIMLAGAAMVFLRRGTEPRSITLLLLAVILALPGAGGDLLVVAAPALTFALFAETSGDERPFLPLVPALLMWTVPLLAALFGAVAWPVVPVLVVAMVLAALGRETAWKRGGEDHVTYPAKAERKGAP